MTADTSVDATPTPEEFGDGPLDEWIAGATIAKRSVEIYGNPGLYAKYEDLERRHAVAKARNADDDALGDEGVQAIEEEMRQLLDQWEASKSTWTVKALHDRDFKRIRDALEWPTQPTAPKQPDTSDPEKAAMLQEAYDVAKAQHDAAMAEYEKQMAELGDQANLEILASAVCDIQFADGRRASGVTVEQLRKLRERLGERQLLKLVQTSQLVTYEEPKVPAPFSPATTRDDQT